MDEIGGCQTEDSFVMKQNLKKYETEKGLERQMHPVLDDDTRKNIKVAEEYQTLSNNIDIVEVDEENEDNFDCESILTTYSTLYNHPKLIKEPSIKVCHMSNLYIANSIFGKLK